MTLNADQKRALRRVTTTGNKHTEVRKRLGAAKGELYRAIRYADAIGVPRGQIAHQGGISRQTLYTILGKEESP